MSHFEGTAPNLIEALKDDDPWVRYFAAKSLGRLNDSSAIDALVEVVENDPLNHVRIAALEALGKLGGNKAVHVISAYVRSDDRDVARVAGEALEEVRLRVTEEQA
jgi:HEAT repeat protein